MREYVIYTDGGYSTSSNVGAAAYIVLRAGEEVPLRQGAFILKNETSQRAEFQAIIAALRTIPDGSHAEVYTDYLYAALGLGRNPRRKNQPDNDLLLQYRKIVRWKRLKVEIQWVPGKKRNSWYALCDSLCTEALEQALTGGQ